METQKAKTWMLVGLISVGLMGTGFSFEKDKEVKSIEGNRLANRKEYKDMKLTMSRIDNDQARLLKHKSELKANKKADLVIAAHMSKKEVKKAKADLRRDKKYLRIDRKDLKSDQRVALKEAKKNERVIAKELREAKATLRKDLRKGNTAQLTADAQKVDYLTWKKDQAALSTARLEKDVDDFFAYLDDEIDETVA